MNDGGSLSQFLESDIEVGDAVAVGEGFVVPLVRTTRVRIPYLPLSGVWQKPIGVVVVDEEGDQRFIPIHDEVRRTQLNILTWSTLGILVLWRLIRRTNN
jgi:hypothetical protein